MIHANPTPEQLKAVRIASRRQAEKVKHSPDVDGDDIAQETWLSLCKSPKSFDPSKAQFTTYASTIATRRAINMHRRHDRRPTTPIGDYDAAILDEPVSVDAPNMPEWVRETRVAMDRRRRGGMKGRTYTHGQEVAVALIAIRCRLSSRATVVLIDARRDVREALDMNHAPSDRMVQMAVKTMRRLLQKRAQSAQTSDEVGTEADKGHGEV
jgi:RNA polymerase sigma factor (sigma-70 family)